MRRRWNSSGKARIQEVKTGAGHDSSPGSVNLEKLVSDWSQATVKDAGHPPKKNGPVINAPSRDFFLLP